LAINTEGIPQPMILFTAPWVGRPSQCFVLKASPSHSKYSMATGQLVEPMCDGFEAITNSTTFFRGVLRLNKDAFKAYD